MTRRPADRVSVNATAQTTLRVLIVAYFLAASVKLTPGTDLSLLFSGILPDPYRGALAIGLVFLFSFMIIAGMATRLATLIIALMIFFADYLTNVYLGAQAEGGLLWRDIALIAALLLTDSEPWFSLRRRRLLHRQIVPRRIDGIMARAKTLSDEAAALQSLRGPRNDHAEVVAGSVAPRREDREHSDPEPTFSSCRRSKPAADHIDDGDDAVIFNIFAEDPQAA